MHELGIAEEMLKVALDYAAKHNAARVTQFNVEMSAAADESEDSLRFHLENAAKGTIAEGAALVVSRMPAHAKCVECGNEFEWDGKEAACPSCLSPRILTSMRDEFKLASIEVD